MWIACVLVALVRVAGATDACDACEKSATFPIREDSLQADLDRWAANLDRFVLEPEAVEDGSWNRSRAWRLRARTCGVRGGACVRPQSPADAFRDMTAGGRRVINAGDSTMRNFHAALCQGYVRGDGDPARVAELKARLKKAAQEPGGMFGAQNACGASLRHVSFYKLDAWHATKATLEAEARPGDLIYVQLPAMHALWGPTGRSCGPTTAPCADYHGTVCGLASTADLASRLDAVAADLAALREAGLNVVVALASPKCDPLKASAGEGILRAYEDQEAAFHAGRAPPLHDGPAADLADRFDAEAAKNRTDRGKFAAAAARVRASGVLEPDPTFGGHCKLHDDTFDNFHFNAFGVAAFNAAGAAALAKYPRLPVFDRARAQAYVCGTPLQGDGHHFGFQTAHPEVAVLGALFRLADDGAAGRK